MTGALRARSAGAIRVLPGVPYKVVPLTPYNLYNTGCNRIADQKARQDRIFEQMGWRDDKSWELMRENAAKTAQNNTIPRAERKAAKYLLDSYETFGFPASVRIPPGRYFVPGDAGYPVIVEHTVKLMPLTVGFLRQFVGSAIVRHALDNLRDDLGARGKLDVAMSITSPFGDNPKSPGQRIIDMIVNPELAPLGLQLHAPFLRDEPFGGTTSSSYYQAQTLMRKIHSELLAKRLGLSLTSKTNRNGDFIWGGAVAIVKGEPFLRYIPDITW